jgi:hypothetical protein
VSVETKTRAEQRLAHIEGLKRPLTDAESEELHRCLHAIYVRNLRNRVLAKHEEEEAELYRKVEAESRMLELHVERG